MMQYTFDVDSLCLTIAVVSMLTSVRTGNRSLIDIHTCEWCVYVSMAFGKLSARMEVEWLMVAMGTDHYRCI